MYTFDDSDPRYLYCYTGTDESTPADYHAMFERWVQRLEKGGRFAVLLVHQQAELHDHDHDEEDEEHKKEEAEIMHAFLAFGREHKENVMQHTVAAVQIIPPAWAEKDPEGWERAKESYRRLVQYNYGISGESFTSLDDAKNWLEEQSRQPASS